MACCCVVDGRTDAVGGAGRAAPQQGVAVVARSLIIISVACRGGNGPWMRAMDEMMDGEGVRAARL